MPFERNVFVNCPFDRDYLPLLRSILFTVLSLRLEPRIALERLESSEARFNKIAELVRESKFGIHDLSRLKAKRKGEYFRLNMPFELGLDVGCRLYGGEPWSSKSCLILETEPYRFQAALSDLAGSDIAVHGDDPLRAMAEIRNWLGASSGIEDIPGPSALWNQFGDFNTDLDRALTQRGYSRADIQAQPISELLPAMRAWLTQRRPLGRLP